VDEPIPLLFVDDRAENLAALKAILAKPEHRLVMASSGEEALALLRLRTDFALILLDVMMPGMDGFEVGRRLKHLEQTTHIPIVFVTAVATEDTHVAMAYSVGAVDYWIKPLDPTIVRKKVAVFVDLYRERRKVEREMTASSKAERMGCEQKLAEAQLSSERRYRRLVEGIDHIIGWSARADTMRLSFVSHRAQALWGYTPMELVAPDFWERHLHPEDRERVLATFRGAIAERTDKECVHRLLTADDRELWLRTGVSLEPAGEGRPAELHGISVDITDVKRAEKEVERLLTAMAHDLRDPLHAIEEEAAALAESVPARDTHIRTKADRIRRLAQRMTPLIETLDRHDPS
jgi:PAS domain S-box-containing protein